MSRPQGSLILNSVTRIPMFMTTIHSNESFMISIVKLKSGLSKKKALKGILRELEKDFSRLEEEETLLFLFPN